MLKKDISFKTRYRHWKSWCVTNRGSKPYKIAVLFGLIHSSFDSTFLPTYTRK